MDELHPAIASVDVRGVPLGASSRVVVILHGVGGNSERFAGFAAKAVARVPDVTVLAPRSAFRAWFASDLVRPPSPTGAEMERALAAVEWTVSQALHAGVPPGRIVVAGFSQGACLALEHAVRAGRDYAGVLSMSGAFLGMGCERGEARRRWGYSAASHLAGIPIRLSGHEADPKVPVSLVRRSHRQLTELGVDVTLRIEPGDIHKLIPADGAVLADLIAAR